MATNFFELATTLNNLGAKWLSEKKINFMPCTAFIVQMSVHINATLYGKMYLLKVLAKLREKTRVAEIPVLQLDCHSGKVT